MKMVKRTDKVRPPMIARAPAAYGPCHQRLEQGKNRAEAFEARADLSGVFLAVHRYGPDQAVGVKEDER